MNKYIQLEFIFVSQITEHKSNLKMLRSWISKYSYQQLI
jgi:hypothetical protein